MHFPLMNYVVRLHTSYINMHECICMHICACAYACVSTVLLRCDLTLAREQFTCTCVELLVACALLLTRNSHKIIR